MSEIIDICRHCGKRVTWPGPENGTSQWAHQNKGEVGTTGPCEIWKPDWVWAAPLEGVAKVTKER